MTMHADEVKKIEKKWKQIREDVGNRWPQLDQTDLKMIDGDSRKLIALVHQKTGSKVSEIEEAIDEIAAQSDGLLDRVTQTIANTAANASNQVRQSGMEAYHSVEESVSSRPVLSAAIAMGTGVVFGILLTRRRRRSGFWHR